MLLEFFFEIQPKFKIYKYFSEESQTIEVTTKINYFIYTEYFQSVLTNKIHFLENSYLFKDKIFGVDNFQLRFVLSN